MEVNPSIPMERTGKIIRRSIHTYLKNYQYFTSTTALLIFPVSVAILLSQAIIPSSSFLLPTIYTRLESIFYAAGFPESSQFFSILNLKLSQTICSSIFTLPFTLSFLLFAKSSIIKALHHQNPSLRPSFSSIFPLCYPLLLTHLCNSFVILAANASALAILFLTFNSIDAFGVSSPSFLLFLSATGAVLYSVILAHTIITCNLALIVAGMENCGGYLAILKACVLIRGRSSTTLLLALPFNLGLAAVEALFQYRVVRLSLLSDKFSSSMAFEGLVIAYLYSILILLDTITTCEFFKSSKSNYRMDLEDKYYYLIELLPEEDSGAFTNSKNLEELP
ncbi:hypothetical protein BVC80_8803g21 [Macleaya cordata]|uniref:Transmembrane protein n=1 Tax=Macleaya cordata TaxID=56857 RepID=A0A200QEJ4_MACCD|nr:hypothetical protein BVC80_8803g21 [Macleaya cordata]